MKNRKLYSIIVLSLTILLLAGCSQQSGNETVSADGVRIKYYVQGKGEPALVFVHGFASDHLDWEFQTTHFSKKHKVVAVELAGFGASGNNREHWTTQAFGQDVISVVKHLDLDRVILIGQSMGGGVILEAALGMPERIIGLVPVDVFQNVEETFTEEQIEQRIDRVMGMINHPDEERLRSAFKREVDPVIIQRIMHCYESSPKIGWRECLRPFINWRQHDLTRVLQQLQCPITCINSDRMETKIEVARKYHPRFDVKFVKNTGHPVMLDAPDDFNHALEDIIAGWQADQETDG